MTGHQEHTTVLTDEQPVHTGAVVAAWISAVITLGYLLPFAVAVTRGKSNQSGIFLINLLAGWTLIGWLVALVMAIQPHQIAGYNTITSANSHASSNSDLPQRVGLGPEITYSTTQWTRSELADVKAALDERGVAFYMDSGLLIVDHVGESATDAIIGEVIGRPPEPTATYRPIPED